MRVRRGREYGKRRQKKPRTQHLGKLTMTSPRMGQLEDEDPAKEVRGSGLWRKRNLESVCRSVFRRASWPTAVLALEEPLPGVMDGSQTTGGYRVKEGQQCEWSDWKQCFQDVALKGRREDEKLETCGISSWNTPKPVYRNGEGKDGNEWLWMRTHRRGTGSRSLEGKRIPAHKDSFCEETLPLWAREDKDNWVKLGI